MARTVDWESAVRINARDSDTFVDPQVAVLDDGGWVVVWKDRMDGFQQSIYMQAFNPDGSKQGREIRVDGPLPQQGEIHSVTALDDGGWAVVWTDATSVSLSAPADVVLRVYNADGSVRISDRAFSTDPERRAEDTSVTALKNGNFVISWDQFDGTPGDGNEVYQILVNRNGAAIGDPIRINPDVTGGQIDISVTALDDGGWVTTWSNDPGFDDESMVTLRRFAENGRPIGRDIVVNAGAADAYVSPETAALEGGGWVTTWVDYDGSDVFFQAFDGDGKKIGGPTEIDEGVDRRQTEVDVAGIDGGGWVVVWTEFVASGSYRIVQQEFDRNGNAVGGPELVEAVTQTPGATVSVDAFENGGWIVTFNRMGDVYQRAFNVPEGPIEGDNGPNNLKGKADDDEIYGLGGDDTLSGAGGDDTLDGGRGNDILRGGGGDDVFVFSIKLGGDNVDRIQDFRPGADEIHLSSKIFKGLDRGNLDADAFVDLSKDRTDADTRVIYDNGRLLYDPDGRGGEKAILFATLTGKPALSASDFEVI